MAKPSTITDCAVALHLAPVVRTVQITRPGRLLTPRDFPDGSWFTLDAIAVIFNSTPASIWTRLWMLRDQLEPPSYVQRRFGGDFRLRRVLSAHDFEILASVLQPSVKSFLLARRVYEARTADASNLSRQSGAMNHSTQ